MEMTGEMLQSSLEEVLSGQLMTAKTLCGTQKCLLQSVRLRDWEAFASDSAVIEDLSNEFAELEKKREELIELAAEKIGREKSFYAVTSGFPQEKRSELNALFRELKRVLVLSKTESMAIARYVAGERATLSSLLEHIVPDARARTYTRRGSLSSGLQEGMVLDTVF